MDDRKALKELIESRDNARGMVYSLEHQRRILKEGLETLREMAQTRNDCKGFLAVATQYLRDAEGVTDA